MPGYISCHGEEVEKDRDRVGWMFGIFESVDGCQTEFVFGPNLRRLDETLERLLEALVFTTL